VILIFATLLIALILDRAGFRRGAVSCLLLCLILSVGLFLWEVYSPEYGFRMPWLRVEMQDIVAPALGA
jgi:hypothetical protein